MRISGTPIAAAASSSSRIATHARPSRRVAQEQRRSDRDPDQEERRPVVPGRVRLVEEVGRQEGKGLVEAVSEAHPVDAVEPERAVREVEPGEVVAVADELGDDLPEPERDDREVVAAQAEGRDPDQDAEHGGEDRSEHDHEPRRDVDPRRSLADGAAEDQRERMAVAPCELLRGEPARDVGAGREEGDVAEVEQTGVADHEVEPEAHHGERGDHERRRHVRQPVRERVREEVVVEDRVEDQQRPDDDRHEPLSPVPGHERVESDSPSRPVGRKTRIRISRMKTSDSVQFGPGACQVSPLLKFSMKPMM